MQSYWLKKSKDFRSFIYITVNIMFYNQPNIKHDTVMHQWFSKFLIPPNPNWELRKAMCNYIYILQNTFNFTHISNSCKPISLQKLHSLFTGSLIQKLNFLSTVLQGTCILFSLCYKLYWYPEELTFICWFCIMLFDNKFHHKW